MQLSMWIKQVIIFTPQNPTLPSLLRAGGVMYLPVSIHQLSSKKAALFCPLASSNLTSQLSYMWTCAVHKYFVHLTFDLETMIITLKILCRWILRIYWCQHLLISPVNCFIHGSCKLCKFLFSWPLTLISSPWPGQCCVPIYQCHHPLISHANLYVDLYTVPRFFPI